MAAAREFGDALTDLRRDPSAAVPAAGVELTRGASREALAVLAALSTDLLPELVDPLLRVAPAERHTLAVRGLLGRLPAAEGDEWAYRRMAELLDHPGLTGALRQLCRMAAESTGPGVREVADDYS